MKVAVNEIKSSDKVSIKFLEKELERAYLDYKKHKNEIISKLITIKNDIHTKKVYCEWINETLNFIKESDM